MSKYLDIWMPCFTCQFGHGCKYYENDLWVNWILKKGVCPAFTYAYDALYYATLADNLEKLELEKNRFKPEKPFNPE